MMVSCENNEQKSSETKQNTTIEKEKVDTVSIQTLEVSVQKNIVDTSEPYKEIDSSESIVITPIKETVFEIPNTFKPRAQSFKINPLTDTVLNVGENGTQLHIPSNAFVDSNGELVTSTVTIDFEEYKNSADMAFSSIPMIYKKANEEFFFNSSGMYAIQGYTDNEKVSIAENKSLSVDYYLAKQNKDIDFYRMEDDSSNWEFVQEIDELTAPAELEIEQVFETVIVKQKLRGRKIVFEDANIADTFVLQDNGNRTNNTLLAEGADAGHTYPAIVKGLNVSSFGVYNCDQIYRVPNRVNISATYVDEDGNKIASPKILSLIDLKYNGAFSFHPKRFTCDAKGNNVLLLFAKSGKLYLLEKGEFKKMNITKSGTYTFKMKEVSKTIKSSYDLAEYLGV